MNDITNSFNPYPYNRMMRYFFTGAELPQQLAEIAAANPGKANHVNSVYQFNLWMKANHPSLYGAVASSKPELLDTAHVVTSGVLTAGSNKMPSPIATAKPGMKGLSGLGQANMVIDPTTGNLVSADSLAITTSYGSASNTAVPPATSWGQSIIDFTKQVLPAGLQAYGQTQLIDLNVKRAEQGLPPVDASAVSPTVQFGVAPGTMNIGYLAIGAIVIFGVLSFFGKRKS